MTEGMTANDFKLKLNNQKPTHELFSLLFNTEDLLKVVPFQEYLESHLQRIQKTTNDNKSQSIT